MTKKHLALLERLTLSIILAPWSHPDLSDLVRRGLAVQQNLRCLNGALSASSAWLITTDGRAVLEDSKR